MDAPARCPDRSVSASAATIGGMRYIIVGAGGVGSTIGARLSESGHEVVLVACGSAWYAAMVAGYAIEHLAKVRCKVTGSGVVSEP